MAELPINPVLQFVRGIAATHDPGNHPDQSLLERFVNAADENAFQVLLRRHGPLVMSVCTRVLGNQSDAEDAFQATFLVLVRKASSLRAPESLAPWLYGVAYRTSLKAKAEVLKRRLREERLVDRASPAASEELVWRDVRLVLDEEVNRLPDRYRIPIVLCYFEGRTNEQAAQLLGCPPGTVFSRLAEARNRLRRQLSRRGLALSTGVLVAVLSGSTASARVPTSSVLVTSQAAMAFAAGPAVAAGTTPVRAAALAEGVLQAMVLTKLKILVVALAVVGVVGLVGGLLTHQALAGGQTGDGSEVRVLSAAPAAPAADEKEKAEEEAKKDKEKFQGTWKVVTLEEKGESKEEPDVRLVFEGDEFIFKKGDDVLHKGKFKLDPSKDPKAIDLEITESVKMLNGKTSLAIYALDKDDKDALKLCLGEPDAERPKEFTGAAETKCIFVTLKREKK